MNRRAIFFFMLLSLLLFFQPVQAAEIYKIDPQHTFILWKINHFGFSMQVGKITGIEGTIELDEAKPQNSKVNVTIPMREIHSGIAKLDEHLKTSDFFDTEKYPTATFVSDKIVLQGKNKAKIYGTLTLHGVSKPVVLQAQLLKQGINPMKNKKSLGFIATTKIKRSEFDIKKYLPNLGDEVKIEIGVEASLEN